MELVHYLHAAYFSPVKSTFDRAIKNNHFASWPELTSGLIKNHLPRPVATVQGHLHQEIQGLQTYQNMSKSNITNMEKIKQIRKKCEQLKNKKKPDQSLEEVLQQDIAADSFPPSFNPNIK